MAKRAAKREMTADDAVGDQARLSALTRVSPEQALAFQTLLWIGIIDQLATTQANRALAAVSLPLPQFTVLNHMVRRDYETHTVSGLAHSFQQPQPGVTKTVSKLVAKKFLKAEDAPGDKRSRVLIVTPAGKAALARALMALAPGIDMMFKGWTRAELQALFTSLDRLKVWLDSNRNLAAEIMAAMMLATKAAPKIRGRAG